MDGKFFQVEIVHQLDQMVQFSVREFIDLIYEFDELNCALAETGTSLDQLFDYTQEYVNTHTEEGMSIMMGICRRAEGPVFQHHIELLINELGEADYEYCGEAPTDAVDARSMLRYFAAAVYLVKRMLTKSRENIPNLTRIEYYSDTILTKMVVIQQQINQFNSSASIDLPYLEETNLDSNFIFGL